jgi:glutathione S-transferase
VIVAFACASANLWECAVMTDTTELVLYHAVPSRSMVARWMLEEVGEPYRLEVLDLQQDDHRKPGFLAINPMGQVPALRHGETVVTEASAICAYLADAFPRAELAPALDLPLRGPYLRWMFFGPSVLEPLALDLMLKRKRVQQSSAWFNHERVLGVLADAVRDGPYLLGDRFTAADVVIGSGLIWAMKMVKVLPENPTLVQYTTRIERRPARRRQVDADMALLTA